MFSTAELDAAIAKIVRTSIRRTVGSSGNRETAQTFNDTQDAAAGVFILQSNAVYYVIALAVAALRADIARAQTASSDLASSVRVLDRRVRPVRNLSPLANAKAALDALAGTLDARSVAFASIELVPAFQRFDKNTQRFLAESGSNVVFKSDVVPTPSEARAGLGTRYAALQEIVLKVVARTKQLTVAVEDYTQLNLPGLLSRSVLQNARTVLTERLAELEGMTESARLDVIRDVTLDILAARATVRGFGSISQPTAFLSMAGPAAVYTDGTHLAAPATLTADLPGPYAILPDLVGSGGDTLYLNVEGDALTVPLLGSFVAELGSTIKAPYDVGAPNTLGVTNDTFTVALRNFPAVGDLTEHVVTIDPSSTVTAFDYAADVNLALPPTTPLVAEPYANPLRYYGTVDTTDISAADLRVFLTNPSLSFTALQIEVGDELVLRTGANAGVTFRVAAVAPGFLDADVVAGPWVGGVEAGVTMELGGGALGVRFRISNILDAPRPEYRETAVKNRVSIYLPYRTGGDYVRQRDALYTLGLVPQSELVSRGTPVPELATAMQQSLSTSLGGVPRVSAAAVFIPSLYTGSVRTEPTSGLLLTLSKLRAAGTTTAGTSVTIAIVSSDSTQIGDTLVLRSHPDPALVGVFGSVTAVTATTLTVLFGTPVSAATVDVEVGPSFGVSPDTVVRIAAGSSNEGEYLVQLQRPNNIDLELQRPLSLTTLLGGQPILETAALGFYHLQVSSTDRTLASSLAVSDPAPDSALFELFNAPTSTVGTTAYVRLPSLKGVEVGDVLELYATQYSTPSLTSAIVGLDTETTTVELSSPFPTTTPSYSLTVGTQVPFARIRKQKLDIYTSLQNDAETWLLNPPAQPAFFLELNRRLNAVAVNANPTLSQVNDVTSFLDTLQAGLDALDSITAQYTAEVVPEVDTLLQSLQERGATRAIAILLEGRFKQFFDLSQDEVSYTGTVQKAVQAVEREDLPISRTDRIGAGAAANALIASYEETDFEFDISDVDDSAEIDIPGTQGLPYPDQSY